MKYDESMHRRHEKLLNAFIVLICIFPLLLAIFAYTKYEFVILIEVIILFIIMGRLHIENVKEDKTRGICKGENRVWSIHLSGGLLCFVGIYLINSRWESLSVSNPLNWVWVLFAVFFIIRGVICIRSGNEYNKTIKRLEICEEKLKYLGYELDEWNEFHKLIPNESNETKQE